MSSLFVCTTTDDDYYFVFHLLLLFYACSLTGNFMVNGDVLADTHAQNSYLSSSVALSHFSISATTTGTECMTVPGRSCNMAVAGSWMVFDAAHLSHTHYHLYSTFFDYYYNNQFARYTVK